MGDGKGPAPGPDQLFFDFAPPPPPPLAAAREAPTTLEPELPGQTVLPWAAEPKFSPEPGRSAEPEAKFSPEAGRSAEPARLPGPPGHLAVAVPLPSSPYDSIADLEELARLALGCRRCGLRDGCRGVVFGEGNPRAAVMFIGEGPGGVEDELGRPFVGPAGKLLDRILASVGFTREEVYITNVVKCRPPGNRVPQPQEREACRPWLEAQMRLIDPPLVVLLGASAAQAMIAPDARITQIRGHWVERRGRRLLPTYHPAALLRDETKKRPVWEDFKLLRAEYDRLVGRQG